MYYQKFLLRRPYEGNGSAHGALGFRAIVCWAATSRQEVARLTAMNINMQESCNRAEQENGTARQVGASSIRAIKRVAWT